MTPDRWTGSIVGLVILAAVCSTTLGCGGPPREVQVATDEAATALDVADQVLAAQIARRGTELRAELVELARAGGVASVDHGLAWYDERMAPYETATVVLELAADTLRALQEAIDAWAAGASDGESRFIEAVACSVAAVTRVPDALERVGVEVPPVVTQWAPTVREYALVACPRAEFATTGGE